jgi:hypothetical protein
MTKHRNNFVYELYPNNQISNKSLIGDNWHQLVLARKLIGDWCWRKKFFYQTLVRSKNSFIHKM